MQKKTELWLQLVVKTTSCQGYVAFSIFVKEKVKVSTQSFNHDHSLLYTICGPLQIFRLFMRTWSFRYHHPLGKFSYLNQGMNWLWPLNIAIILTFTMIALSPAIDPPILGKKSRKANAWSNQNLNITLREAFSDRSCSYSLLMRLTSALREAFSSFKASARWASSSHSAWLTKTYKHSINSKQGHQQD